MIIVEIKNNETLERALKIYKSKVIKTKQTQKLQERKEFTKPSVVKRTKLLKAIYIQKKKNQLD